LPEGAARERGTEITSRTSSQGRSLRALLYPDATAFLRRPRASPAGRDRHPGVGTLVGPAGATRATGRRPLDEALEARIPDRTDTQLGISATLSNWEFHLARDGLLGGRARSEMEARSRRAAWIVGANVAF